MKTRTGSVLLTFLMLGSVAWGAETEEKSLEEALDYARRYELGQDTGPMQVIIGHVLAAQGDLYARNALANKLAGLLGPDSTFECKKFICRQLYLIGTEEQVDQLEPLLAEPELAHVARIALQDLPGDAANAALAAALDSADGPAKAGIINSLSARPGQGNAARLAPLLTDSNSVVAAAAADGLGRLGGEEAASALKAALEGGGPQASVIDALLRCADRWLEEGKKKEAAAIYSMFKDAHWDTHVRLAAMRGNVEAEGEAAVELVVAALTSGDPVWQVPAMRYVRTIPGEAATEALMETLSDLDEEMLAVMAEALGDRGDPAALPAVTDLLASEAEPIQLAALAAVRELGDASSVEPLTGLALEKSRAVRSAAIDALAGLRGPGVNEAILARLDRAGPEQIPMLIGVLAARRAHEASPMLVKQAQRSSEEIRTAAYEALGALARQEDLPALVALVVDAAPDSRDAAQGAVVDAARRMPEGEPRVGAVLAALENADHDEVRAALLSLLGGIGDSAGIGALREGAGSASERVRGAAIAALADWPTPDPLDTLQDLAKTAQDPEDRRTALEGGIRQLRILSGRKPRQAAEGLEQALTLADEVSLKRAALAALSEIKDRHALEVAESYLADAELREEAAITAEKIRRHFYSAEASNHAGDARKALDGDIGSRWTTGEFQRPGQWYQLDFGSEVAVKGLYLDTSRSPADYPRGYEVFVFDDASNMGSPVVSGQGEKPVMELTWPAVSGRYLRIVQTGTAPDKYWSIHELRVIPE